jgi:hypothetical protein
MKKIILKLFPALLEAISIAVQYLIVVRNQKKNRIFATQRLLVKIKRIPPFDHPPHGYSIV